MASIDPLDPRLLEGLEDFNADAWDFPTRNGFLNWFFRDSPDTAVLVSHDQGNWRGALGVFDRTYLIGGEPVLCSETYAWATHSAHRSSGVGIKLMKAMIDRGRPLVALGGSSDTLSLMPRLGFKTVAQAPALNLPLLPQVIGARTGMAEFSGLKARLARLGLTFLAPVLKPRPGSPHGLRYQPIAELDEDDLSMRPAQGLQAVYEPRFFRWLVQAPARTATYLPFRFVRDGAVAGWVFARVSEEAPGEVVGRILECKFDPYCTARDHKAMLGVVTAALAGFGAMIIRSLATCPDTTTALRSLKYVSRAQLPAMIHPAGLNLPDEPVRMSMIRADGGLLPLPIADPA